MQCHTNDCNGVDAWTSHVVDGDGDDDDGHNVAEVVATLSMPKRAARSVSLALDNIRVFEVVPYSEVYGIHPQAHCCDQHRLVSCAC